jgi:hypothetical protein
MVVFLSPPGRSWIQLRLIQNCLLPNPFHFLILLYFYHSTLYTLSHGQRRKTHDGTVQIFKIKSLPTDLVKKRSLSKPLRYVAVGGKFISNPVFLPLCMRVCFQHHKKCVQISHTLNTHTHFRRYTVTHNNSSCFMHVYTYEVCIQVLYIYMSVCY